MELDQPGGAERLEDGSRLTRSRLGSPASPIAATDVVDGSEHNVVFTSLVTGDKDIVGLVAYSIYKQNKYDWLMAFSRHRGRMPNPEEAHSYLYGESTPRRLATYRHLAEATLGGRGLEVPGSSSGPLPSSGAFLAARPGPHEMESPRGPERRSGRPLIIGVLCLVLVILGLVWFFHGGPAPK